MSDLRQSPVTELLKIPGVSERHRPDRDEGFSSLCADGKEFAHFHHDNELDIRLGKSLIAALEPTRPTDSRQHPTRSPNSPWIELRFSIREEIA